MKKRIAAFLSLQMFPGLQAPETFANPLLPSGPDPYSFYKDGYYYYTNSMSDSLVIWRTTSIANLETAERKTIFRPPPNTAYSKERWAPEILFLHGKWDAYFAAENGNNNFHRKYVLENESTDPMQGEWQFKSRIGYLLKQKLQHYKTRTAVNI